MKKLIISIFILISLILCGCNDVEVESQILNTFTIVSEIQTFDVLIYQKLNIVYDNETKIMYYVYYYDRGVGLTPIYNSDGSIKIYTEK